LNIFRSHRSACHFEPREPLRTAVLFLIFNRPDTTAPVFETIRKARPPRLYVAADGPRKGRPGEAEKVDEARQIASNVDWPCEVKTLFREENLGCKHAVSQAITWFFGQEEQGIILEDDTLPSQSFFWFCEALLDLYKQRSNVMHIGGYKPNQVGRDAYSFSFTRATHIWGWATWRDRWSRYRVDPQIAAEDIDTIRQFEYFLSRRKTKRRADILKRLLAGKIDTWDYQWNLAVRTQGGLGIRPCVSLVANIGHGRADATHTSRSAPSERAADIDAYNLKCPPWILPNRNLEKQFEKGL
jgi:hypothetical protein